MAIELFTDNPSSGGISPRISFSHDLKNSDIIPIEPHIPLKSSLLDYDFDFNTTPSCYDHQPSLADELFANGIILPIQINTKTTPIITKSKSFSPSSSNINSSLYLPPLPTIHHHKNDEIIYEKQGYKSTNNKSSSSSSSSFWKFKRSKSLNCRSIYTRGLCPLPLLSRSKSTGSSTSAKRSLISKDESLHSKHKISSSSSFYQKPPLNKKIYGANNLSGVFQVSPVINVPTGKVFGFGSIFSTTKDKTKKK